MNINIKNNWNEITLKEFEQMQSLDKDSMSVDEYILNLVAILSDVTLDELKLLPFAEVLKLNNSLSFLSKPMENQMPKPSIVIRGRKYEIMTNPANMSTSQFLDFRILAEQKERRKRDLLSVFIIPKGMEYGSYSLEEVKEDIDYLSITFVEGLLNFFSKVSVAYSRTFLQYLKRQMKKESRLSEVDRHLTLQNIAKIEQAMAHLQC